MNRSKWKVIALSLATLVVGLGPSRAQEPTGGGAPPPDAGPAPVAQNLPGKVETGVVEGPQPEREERVIVTTPSIVYTFTTRGATLSKAVLQDPRFTHAARTPVPGVPSDKLVEGQIDMVTTWGTKWLPFSSEFGKLGYPGQATMVIRRGKGGAISNGSIKGGQLEAPSARGELAVDRPVMENDLLRVTAPPSLAAEYRVAKVGPGGAITPSKPFPESTATGVAYEVVRIGAVDVLYDQNRNFTRVSATPGLPLVYVWPDPSIDQSPIWIERRFDMGQSPFELKLAVTVHNVGGELAQVQNGLRIGGWQHPEAKGQSFFGAPTPVLQSSCLALDGIEHAPFATLREKAIEKWEQQQPARELQSYASGAQWIAIDTNYFIQAAAPTPFTELGGQCQLGLQDFNPTVPGAWVMWSAFTAPNLVEIPARVDACSPDFLPMTADGPKTERCKASLDRLGIGPAASADEVKAAWEKARARGGDVASADRAYELLKNRPQATWRFNLFNGPKDTNLLPLSHPDLKRSVQFGWMQFIGAPMHKVLTWFHEGLGSWPLAIILLTFALKLITWPLSQKSYVSMQRMKELKPKLDELKKKFGNDRQRFASEQMALMKREGVSPFAGCLPMLLQLPIWVGLYGAILGSVELYHEPLGLWVPDLSSSDPYFVMPILVGVIQFVQMWLTPQAATDEMQAKIMKYGMPIMFTLFMLFLPSALVLYILVNSILTIVQNLLIKRRMEARA